MVKGKIMNSRLHKFVSESCHNHVTDIQVSINYENKMKEIWRSN